jgi:NAD(P)-dependent dehydrogenase (short-subunit alcohol dehydrogenase family)
LHARLADVDPVTASLLRPSDPQRILRALEVYEATGMPLSRFQTGPRQPFVDNWVGLFLSPERADLNQRINGRFDGMLAHGVLEEVRRLHQARYDPALPIMRAQKSGVILMISSISAWENYPNVAYKITKAGMIAFTQQLAIRNAQYNIRANAILPGLMATPMAIDVRARVTNTPRERIMAERASRVPLRRQGTAWDVANAALFLASDEANFITGVSLPVDGGMLVDIAPGRSS